jgi:transposase InsO family protein
MVLIPMFVEHEAKAHEQALERLAQGSRCVGNALTTDQRTQSTSNRFPHTLKRLGIAHRGPRTAIARQWLDRKASPHLKGS